MTERRAPCPRAIAIARSTAPRWPLTTTCPGALSLATAQISSCSIPARVASAATNRAASASSPISAAIAPAPTGTARCIARPRSFNSRAASPGASAPAAANAEYSPSECPATKATCRAMSRPPSVSSTRMTARLAAISAGWAFSVKVSSLSGPSNISRDSGCDKASSTSSNSRRAAGKPSARLRPMPTACEP